ncbi:serine/threonine protein kinase [Chitiniphilus eburneus]|uniref:non-specific serine/threonine protein kinase n=1 Tax=Chitiniphilus eburneus TaxID=2571148 RepID=A0A4U0Q8D2_9NEIS|nr:serine/threonine-protein kinase [Chitiniphilus eburneus]TJZ77533.1 serine/threonine protein kinase [Chitiniphilus eburneus]
MVNDSTDDVAQAICRTLGLSYVQPCAAGAFKKTYLVQDGHTPLALKIVQDDLHYERIKREAQAHRTCDHPHIARLLCSEVIRYEGREFFYFIEPFLTGGTLTERLATGVLPIESICQLGVALVDALCHLDDRGIVHRDIKPDNILFNDEDKPVLVDFGIARHLTATSLTQTWLLHGPGTPAFAAPEQLNNEKHLIDWRTDQFALGVTLSIAALGVHPFAYEEKLDSTIERVMRRDGPSTYFKNMACKQGLEVLIQMVNPWPVRRVLRPEILLKAWQSVGGAHIGCIPSGRI